MGMQADRGNRQKHEAHKEDGQPVRKERTVLNEKAGRSAPMAVSDASRKKQTPSSHKGNDVDGGLKGGFIS